MIKIRNGLGTRFAAIICALVLLSGIFCFANLESSAQGALRRARQQRRQERIQKRLERQEANKLSAETETATPDSAEGTPSKESVRPEKHSLDGISKTGLIELFPKAERQMAIPGVGRPLAFLIILRQLDLTEPQKQSIREIRQRVGDRLRLYRLQQSALENQLEEAIYGTNFDSKRVEETSAKLGEVQSQIIKIQAGIESDFRQILTPDQFYVFRLLIGEILPQRRIPLNQLRQQMQRRMGGRNNPIDRPDP